METALTASGTPMRNKWDELRKAAEAMVAVADLYTSVADPRTILALLAENARLLAALTIDREEVGRIMHDSWRLTKESQGFHRPPLREAPCDKCHADMIPWEELPEHQKDINRHAFDAVLAEIQRRVALGDAP